MAGDLLGTPLRGDVLGASQWCATATAGETQQIFGNQRHSATRALLPRRVGRRVDDHLAHDSPAGMVRVATGDKETCQCLGDVDRFRFGSVTVEMA